MTASAPGSPAAGREREAARETAAMRMGANPSMRSSSEVPFNRAAAAACLQRTDRCRG